MQPNLQGTLDAMIRRAEHVEALAALIQRHPIVAILGPRQSGKTTLARTIARRFPLADRVQAVPLRELLQRVRRGA